ncbi:hypothetical protein Xcel_1759 [Xylanimonas cellulosilytica DSM 15894]|uniref:Uncharacterized protein n=1 Tax=Xylanimonas cellulosilytica (strain DSM 15894 / JCM 12276 / CECT 5975 / KCTC 9989 / LMG 20990 / NBRC 107835 / XIL07) TaxID=446471 RepID=D1BST7_XYLCX|nr:hypothetical protein Xcel_1759 [Xylanimonas cellulosilytica DSM 15894]
MPGRVSRDRWRSRIREVSENTRTGIASPSRLAILVRMAFTSLMTSPLPVVTCVLTPTSCGPGTASVREVAPVGGWASVPVLLT